MVEPANTPIRAVVVGFGAQAESAHLPVMRAASPRFELVGCVDAAPARRTRAQELCPGICVGESVVEVVRAAQANLVVVASPPYWRVDPIAEARSCGVRRFLCEKPIARDRSQLESLRSLSRGLEIFPCHTWLYARSHRTAVAALRRGDVGKVRRVVFETHRSRPARGSSGWVPDWRVRPELAGGGILMDHGYHCVYLAADALGEWPSAVEMSDSSTGRYEAIEDRCEVRLRFAAGTEAVIRLNWSAGFRGFTQRFEGDQGTLEVENRNVTIVRADGSRQFLERGAETAADGIHRQWYRRLYRSLGEALETPGVAAANFADALRTMEVLFDAYDSAAAEPG